MNKSLSFILLCFILAITSCKKDGPISHARFQRLGSTTLCPQGEQRIPKIIHQIWHQFPGGTATPPAQYQEWTRELLQNHPGWTYMLWNAENSRELLARHYPWFLNTYDDYDRVTQGPIKKVDAIRPFLMHHFGGVYIDMDQQNLRNLESLLGTCDLVLSEGDRDNYIIVNGFMASVPKHLFWLEMAKEMPKNMKKIVNFATGPYLIHQVAHTYIQKVPHSPIKVYDPIYILPFAWNQEQSVLEQCKISTELCKKLLPDSYVAMHYGHSWKDQK